MPISDFEDRAFRPRIGGRRGQIKPQRMPTFRSTVIARIHQRIRCSAGPKPAAASARKRHPTAGFYGDKPTASSRRCIVKARIVRMAGGGIKAARLHLAYIERDGVEQDGSKGELYGDSERMFKRERLAAALPKEAHQFRFIVSPEDGAELDLREFTRSLMKEVENDLGRRLIWGAVNHHDTDNPHVHVVVRDVDLAGHPLRIDREYITQGMRWRAQEVATLELGPRDIRHIERQRNREIGQERLTSLDRDLARLINDTGEVGLREMAATTKPEARMQQVARLATLAELGLAQPVRPGSWRLEPGWQASLKELGEQGDILKRIHAAVPYPGEGAHLRVVDGTSEIAPVEGILRRKGLHDELRGDMYAVVEDPHGEAHYVRIDAATAERLTEGTIVRAEVQRDSWAKPMDAVLQQVSAESGGIYDPQRHLASLAMRPLVVGGQSVDPGDVIAANVRRLARLERHQLAARLPDGRWRVPSDLVVQLKARETAHPRFRVHVDQVAPGLEAQVKTRGPTWLDSVEPRAFYGFGAETTRASAQRTRYLRDLGIEGSAKEINRGLIALERADAGKRVAEARGLTFIAEPSPGFRGTLVPCPGPGRDKGYVAILDERGRRFTVVPDFGESGPLRGQVVELGFGEDGRLLVKRRELSRGR
jgi:type IV secretory pathway VirD2 relaxase